MKNGLSHYLAQWNLSDARPIAQTFLGQTYKVQSSYGPAVLKIFTAIGSADGIAGALTLRFFDGGGAVRLFEGDAGAMLIEYADGRDLTGLVREGKDDEATAKNLKRRRCA